MKKLSTSVLEKCNATNCIFNEFIVLPDEGDVGFEEYFDYKTREVIKYKRIFSPMKQNRLMLAYPSPDTKDYMVFNRFFESPYIVGCNHEFEGCFGIDISAYIGKTKDEHFEMLMSYIRSNPSVVYVLFAYSNNKNEIKKLYDTVMLYENYRYMEISLPTPNELCEYTMSHIRDFSLHIKRPVAVHLESYFQENCCGYETADYIIRRLKSSGYDGELEGLQNLLAENILSKNMPGSSLGFGY